MRVLITGAKGQVGRALLTSAPLDIECIAIDRQSFDLTDHAALEHRISTARPDVIINAAAYTAVDKAESERELAFAVNGQSVGALARLSAARGIRLIHISTDFVFDGLQATPYRTHDATHPLSVYGESKLAGERAMAGTEGLSWLIMRAAWVYASEGRNFLLTMLRLFRERETVSVVADQVGTPTSARSLAKCLWKAVSDTGRPDILHFTDAGVASWYDFAVAIYEEACACGLLDREVQILPITTADYPTPARRPAYSVLDKTETVSRLDVTLVHWRSALRDVIREIKR